MARKHLKSTRTIMWGYYGVSGRWFPNPQLKMSRQEQAEENHTNGFPLWDDKINLEFKRRLRYGH